MALSALSCADVPLRTYTLSECNLFLSFAVLESQLRAAETLKPAVCGLKINEICLPGNTLLWDLLQDQNIVSIAIVVV